MTTRLGRLGYLLAFALPLVGLLPADAGAQGVATDFDGLHGRVLLGENVKVTSRDGVSIRGRLLRLTKDDLTIRLDGQERTVPALEIAEVKARRSGPLWNGAVIGAASVAIPFAILSAKYDCENCAVGGLVWTGIGAAIGVGIDALVKGDITVMKAPAAGAKTRVSVAPVVQRERRGVVFTIGF
jgi:hypothetical protein